MPAWAAGQTALGTGCAAPPIAALSRVLAYPARRCVQGPCRRPRPGRVAAVLRLSKGTVKPARPSISPGVSNNPGSAGFEGAPLRLASLKFALSRLRVVKRLFNLKPATPGQEVSMTVPVMGLWATSWQ
jgi:hypothetical protein